MKSIFTKLILMSLFVVPLGAALQTQASVLPIWDVTGSYTIDMNYLGTDYEHGMTLTQDSAGNITGFGGSPAVGPVYTWVIATGTINANVIDITANYTATADAVTPQTVLHIVGTVATSGAMSGTWSDNYQGGDRSGTWTTTTGEALAQGTLQGEDFGVVSYDTGMGMLKGYTAGFGLNDATFEGAQSIVIELYSSTTLLQTNISTAKVTADVTGNQISSPFDVSGTFDYAADGYWTNTRSTEYGQTLAATRVVATVVLANGKTVTAENMVLVGDPSTIFVVVTPPVEPPINPNLKSECKNGGWKTFTEPNFKNQGQCVSSVNHKMHETRDMDKKSDKHEKIEKNKNHSSNKNR